MYGMRDNFHEVLVFFEGCVCIYVMHEILECLCLIMFIMNCGLTHSGRSVDRLPCSYGWVDGVQD